MRWEGPGSGFENSSGGAGGGWKSVNLEFLEFCPFGIGLEKNRFGNGLKHNRTKVSGTWAETESFHTNFSRSRLSFMAINHESGWLGPFTLWELSPDLRLSLIHI